MNIPFPLLAVILVLVMVYAVFKKNKTGLAFSALGFISIFISLNAVFTGDQIFSSNVLSLIVVFSFTSFVILSCTWIILDLISSRRLKANRDL